MKTARKITGLENVVEWKYWEMNSSSLLLNEASSSTGCYAHVKIPRDRHYAYLLTNNCIC